MIYRALAVLMGLAAAGFAGFGLGMWISGPTAVVRLSPGDADALRGMRLPTDGQGRYIDVTQEAGA